MTSCGFTGYRYGKLPFSRMDGACIEALKDQLRLACEDAIDAGCTHFISGFAQGADLLFAETVLELRGVYDNITLEAALPFPAPHLRYCRRDMLQYAALLPRCQSVTMVRMRERRGCYYARNDYILDNSARMIAVFDGKPGGTAYTVEGAKKRGLPLWIIRPQGG